MIPMPKTLRAAALVVALGACSSATHAEGPNCMALAACCNTMSGTAQSNCIQQLPTNEAACLSTLQLDQSAGACSGIVPADAGQTSSSSSGNTSAFSSNVGGTFSSGSGTGPECRALQACCTSLETGMGDAECHGTLPSDESSCAGLLSALSGASSACGGDTGSGTGSGTASASLMGFGGFTGGCFAGFLGVSDPCYECEATSCSSDVSALVTQCSSAAFSCICPGGVYNAETAASAGCNEALLSTCPMAQNVLDSCAMASCASVCGG
jgi:hypothetical protein